MGRKTAENFLYMLVTDDEFELPVIVAPTVNELAERAGVSPRTIHVEVWKKNTGRAKKSRYIRVELEEEDE